MVLWFIRRQMRGHRQGLSLPQFRALVHVDRTPRASLSSVAEHLGASLPTTSRIVAGLVDKGLMLRQSARDDRRQISLALTDRGRSMLVQARQETQQRLQSEMSGLNCKQRESVVEAMNILKELFGPVHRCGGPGAYGVSREASNSGKGEVRSSNGDSQTSHG